MSTAVVRKRPLCDGMHASHIVRSDVNRSSISTLLISTILIVIPLLAHAQDGAPVTVTRFTTGVSVRSWNLDTAAQESDIGITQTMIPITVDLQIASEQLALSIHTAAAFTGISSNTDPDLNGATDTRLQLTYRPENERLVGILGLTLPTGRNDLDDNEVIVSRTVSNDVFGFPINHYGEGLQARGHLVAAYPLTDRVSIGASMGYAHSGSYAYAPDASLGLGDLDPSDSWTLSAGASYRYSEESLWSGHELGLALNADAILRGFTPDKVEGLELFTEGNEIELRGTAALSTARSTHSLFLRTVSKAGNELERAGSDLDTGSTVLNTLFENVTGNWWELGARTDYQFRPGLRVGARGRLRAYEPVRVTGATSQSTVAVRGKSIALEVGPTARAQVTPTLALLLSGSYLTGNAADHALDLNGFDTSIAAEMRF